jgi:predicted enzyme related to lactoylglutathione lyase
MLFVGDIHVYVSDFTLAERFWADGFGLEVKEKEVTRHSAYARLNFPDGGPSIRLIGPVNAASDDAPLPVPLFPTVRFDVTTSDFDGTLTRLLENGGRQIDEITAYNDLRCITLADPDGNMFELLEMSEDDETEAE